jgi:hypothetical protein
VLQSFHQQIHSHCCQTNPDKEFPHVHLLPDRKVSPLRATGCGVRAASPYVVGNSMPQVVGSGKFGLAGVRDSRVDECQNHFPKDYSCLHNAWKGVLTTRWSRPADRVLF